MSAATVGVLVSFVQFRPGGHTTSQTSPISIELATGFRLAQRQVQDLTGDNTSSVTSEDTPAFWGLLST